MAQRSAFDDEALRQALQAAFGGHQTPLPVDVPLALTPLFAEDRVKQAQRAAFSRKSRLAAPGLTLVSLIPLLAAFLFPPVQAAARGGRLRLHGCLVGHGAALISRMHVQPQAEQGGQPCSAATTPRGRLSGPLLDLIDITCGVVSRHVEVLRIPFQKLSDPRHAGQVRAPRRAIGRDPPAVGRDGWSDNSRRDHHPNRSGRAGAPAVSLDTRSAPT